MVLSVAAIKASTPESKPCTLADSEGLHLLIAPSGRRTGARTTVTSETGRRSRIKRERQNDALAASCQFKTIADEWIAKSEREGHSPG